MLIYKYANKNEEADQRISKRRGGKRIWITKFQKKNQIGFSS